MQALLDGITRFETEIARGRSVNVNGASTKQRAIDLAGSYFGEHRPQLLVRNFDHSRLAELDEEWQRLVRLAHGNNSRSSYRKSLRKIRGLASDLSVLLVSTPLTLTLPQQETRQSEQALLTTLKAIVPTAAASYEQAIRDLASGSSRISYRGTASELREAFREILDHLAPDSEVTAEPGFKLENGRTGPTMKQKVRFILVSRARTKTQRTVTERAADLIENLAGDIARAVYDRASLATHVQTLRDEVLRLKRYIDTVLTDVLEIRES